MSWRRDAKGALQSLSFERKVLAERYTIDADEASRREQLAAEEAERRAAAEEAVRAAAAEEARRVHEAEVMRAAAESARTGADEAARPALTTTIRRDVVEQPFEAPSAQPELEAAPGSEGTADLPIYRWFGAG